MCLPEPILQHIFKFSVLLTWVLSVKEPWAIARHLMIKFHSRWPETKNCKACFGKSLFLIGAKSVWRRSQQFLLDKKCLCAVVMTASTSPIHHSFEHFSAVCTTHDKPCHTFPDFQPHFYRHVKTAVIARRGAASRQIAVFGAETVSANKEAGVTWAAAEACRWRPAGQQTAAAAGRPAAAGRQLPLGPPAAGPRRRGSRLAAPDQTAASTVWRHISAATRATMAVTRG